MVMDCLKKMVMNWPIWFSPSLSIGKYVGSFKSKVMSLQQKWVMVTKPFLTICLYFVNKDIYDKTAFIT